MPYSEQRLEIPVKDRTAFRDYMKLFGWNYGCKINWAGKEVRHIVMTNYVLKTNLSEN